MVCQAALISIRPLRFLISIFEGLSILLCDLAESYINKLSMNLSIIAASSQESLTLENPVIQQVLGQLQVLHQWVAAHQNILERFESKKYYGFDLFAQSPKYATVLTQIVGILVTTSQQNVGCIISISGLEKLDQQLNQIKLRSLQSVNVIFKYIFNEIPSEQKNTSEFPKKGVQIYPFIVSTLLYISQREDLESILQDETYQDLIVEIMETLSMFIHEKEFYQQISVDMQSIGVNIGLTLLRTSKSELE